MLGVGKLDEATEALEKGRELGEDVCTVQRDFFRVITAEQMSITPVTPSQDGRISKQDLDNKNRQYADR